MYIDEFVEDLSNCIGFISGDELILKKNRYDFEYEIITRNRDKKLGSIKWDIDNHYIVILLNNKSYTFDPSELTIEKTKEIGKMINKAYYNMDESFINEEFSNQDMKNFKLVFKNEKLDKLFSIHSDTVFRGGFCFWIASRENPKEKYLIRTYNNTIEQYINSVKKGEVKYGDGYDIMLTLKHYRETHEFKEYIHGEPMNESLENAKKLLKENGYLLKENANELTKQEKYALLYLLLKEQGVKLTSNFKDSVIDDQEIDFVINDEYPASIKNGQFGGMSDDLADDPDTIYYAVWFSDDEDDYREETYDINEIIEYVKAGKWNQFVKEELLSW